MTKIFSKLLILILLLTSAKSLKGQDKFSISLQEEIDLLYQYIESTQIEKGTILLDKLVLQFPFSENDSLFASTYHQLGQAYHDVLKDDISAIKCWQKALKIRRTLYDELHPDFIRSHVNIGLALYDLQKLEQAKDTLIKSLTLIDQLTALSPLKISCHNIVGDIFNQQGDFYQAKLHLDKSLGLHTMLYSRDTLKYLRLFYYYQSYYKQSNQSEELIRLSSKLVDFIEREIKKPQDKEIKDDLVNNYTFLGIAYDKIDSTQLAIKYYDKSLELFESADTYIDLSIAYRQQGRLNEALEMANIAVELDKKESPSVYLAESLNSKAMALLALDRLDAALTTIDLALEQLDETPAPLDKKLFITLSKDKMEILERIATKEKTNSPLLEAIEIANEIIPIIEKIRQDYQSDHSKRFLSTETKSFFEQAISIYWHLHERTQSPVYALSAFEMSERSKSITLLEALLDAKAKNQQTNFDSLFQKEAKIRRQIKDVELELSEFSNTKDTSFFELNNKLISLNQQLKDQVHSSKAKDALFYENIYSDINYKNIDIITKNLKGDLIEFFVGEQHIYTFVFQKNKSDLLMLKVPIKNINHLIQQFRESILQSAPIKSNNNDIKLSNEKIFDSTSYQLYQKLIAPIEAKVQLNDRIVIIPDDIIGYIPFEALLKEYPVQSGNWSAYQYLLHYYTIQYNYSLTLMKEMQNQELGTTKINFVGFAPSFDNRMEKWLKPLANNISEITNIQKLIGGQIFTNNSANKQTFINQASQALIVHLATHGKADNKEGDFAKLALTKTAEDTGILYNRELYDLHLNADMVVLSACETGTGQLQKGEGIISLARGFSYAGAKSIITTLWSINDKRTSRIMKLFYQYIKEKEDKDIALCKAKRSFIKEDSFSNSHPYYWAGLISIGDTASISLKRFGLPCWLLSTVLILFIFYIIRQVTAIKPENQ